MANVTSIEMTFSVLPEQRAETRLGQEGIQHGRFKSCCRCLEFACATSTVALGIFAAFTFTWSAIEVCKFEKGFHPLVIPCIIGGIASLRLITLGIELFCGALQERIVPGAAVEP